MAQIPFNPLDKRRLGESVANALLKRQVGSLPPKERFEGAGIYAIYYIGGIPFYKPLAERNHPNQYQAPIYVGKAVPPGARKGGFGLDEAPGSVLWNRLNEHSQSLQAANLPLDHFPCRYLIADDIWIPLGENLLIEMFRPLWNVVITGFGNHDPGRGRRAQEKSLWDTLHPGRPWASTLPAHPKSAIELQATITDFFAGRKVTSISSAKAVTEEES